jgi:S-(hydroxymethyl)glutathione dehydrogenase/alcohol dehydrogenase
MRGIVFDGRGIEVVSDLEVRDPGPGEVGVRVEAAGLCHSDLAVLKGRIPWPAPSVLGHEGAGTVAALGPGVDHLAVGDRVVLSTLASCGHCAACDRGRPTQCRATFGNRSEPFARGGRPVGNFAATSVFVERTLVKAVQAVPIPKDVPMASAALIGCAVLTGMGAVRNRANVSQGDAVGVIGVGGIGLNVLQGSKLAGALPIVAIDANADKEEIARRFGATHFVHADGVDVPSAVRAIREDGLDYAFECVGRAELVTLATRLLDWGGTAIILGVAPFGEEARIDVSSMYQDKGILACRYGSARPQHDVPLYAELYRSGRLLLDELVTRTYPLEDVERALADLEAGRLARGVLTL